MPNKPQETTNPLVVSKVHDLMIATFGLKPLRRLESQLLVFADMYGIQVCADVIYAIKEYNSSLATFERFMERGDLHSQVIFYLTIRKSLQLNDEDASVSLEAIRNFYTRFRGLSDDAEAVVDFLLQAHDLLADRLHLKHFWQSLDFITTNIPEDYQLSYPETVLEFVGEEE